MRRNRGVLIVLVATGCAMWVGGLRGLLAQATPAASAAEGMRDHFADITEIQQAILRANLDEVRPAAKRLTTVSVPPGMPEQAGVYVTELREEHADGLEIYVMCEIPANVVLAEAFLSVFDGFSIGSNDLTQLTLGIDRDSVTVAHLFDERNAAVTWMLEHVIRAAKRVGKPVGICGQAPSDYPELAARLVELGISSISLNPDAVIAATARIAAAEQARAQAEARL